MEEVAGAVPFPPWLAAFPSQLLDRSLLGLVDLEGKVLISSVNLLLKGGAVALHSCTIWH